MKSSFFRPLCNLRNCMIFRKCFWHDVTWQHVNPHLIMTGFSVKLKFNVAVALAPEPFKFGEWRNVLKRGNNGQFFF